MVAGLKSHSNDGVGTAGFLVITGVGQPAGEAHGVLCATGERNLREDGLSPGDLGTSGCNRLLACFSTLKLSLLDPVQPMVGEIAYKVDTLLLVIN